MLYLKINNRLYSASFNGKMQDKDWDNRASKEIVSSTLPINEALELFHDDAVWSILDRNITLKEKLDENGEAVLDENGEVVMEEATQDVEYDNSDYNILGDITKHNDGTVSIKMGKATDLEVAYEIAFGGEV